MLPILPYLSPSPPPVFVFPSSIFSTLLSPLRFLSSSYLGLSFVPPDQIPPFFSCTCCFPLTCQSQTPSASPPHHSIFQVSSEKSDQRHAGLLPLSSAIHPSRFLPLLLMAITANIFCHLCHRVSRPAGA